MGTVNILGIVGSLRRGSFNRGLMRAAQELAPEGVRITVAEIGDLPLFSEDLERDAPEAVRAFKRQVREADAVLFATPEYNYSVPGVLKNAVDWASRPYGDNSFDGKPAAVMGASVGMLGTARAQYHLRQIFVFLNVHALNRPEIMVPDAHENFDAEGNLTNEKTREKIGEMLGALADWARKLR
jgi:chromate reductase, NAD(P)H dehydrogenase (quinone)